MNNHLIPNLPKINTWFKTGKPASLLTSTLALEKVNVYFPDPIANTPISPFPTKSGYTRSSLFG